MCVVVGWEVVRVSIEDDKTECMPSCTSIHTQTHTDTHMHIHLGVDTLARTFSDHGEEVGRPHGRPGRVHSDVEHACRALRVRGGAVCTVCAVCDRRCVVYIVQGVVCGVCWEGVGLVVCPGSGTPAETAPRQPTADPVARRMPHP